MHAAFAGDGLSPRWTMGPRPGSSPHTAHCRPTAPNPVRLLPAGSPLMDEPDSSVGGPTWTTTGPPKRGTLGLLGPGTWSVPNLVGAAFQGRSGKMRRWGACGVVQLALVLEMGGWHDEDTSCRLRAERARDFKLVSASKGARGRVASIVRRKSPRRDSSLRLRRRELARMVP